MSKAVPKENDDPPSEMVLAAVNKALAHPGALNGLILNDIVEDCFRKFSNQHHF